MAQDHQLATFYRFFTDQPFNLQNDLILKRNTSRIKVSFQTLLPSVICMTLTLVVTDADQLPPPYDNEFDVLQIDGILHARHKFGWLSAPEDYPHGDWRFMAHLAETRVFYGMAHLFNQVGGNPHEEYTWAFDRFVKRIK